MTTFSKPNTVNQPWAAGGTIVVPSDSKISTGWIQEQPAFEYWNWLANRADAFNAHVNQFGIPVWDSVTTYIANKSYTQGSNGIVYVAVANNSNVDPTTDNGSNWIPYLGNYQHNILESNMALVASETGTTYLVYSGVTVTLPAKQTDLVFIFTNVSGDCTIQSPDSANIYIGNSFGSSLTLPIGASVTLYCDNANWIASTYSGFSDTQVASDNSRKNATTAFVQAAKGLTTTTSLSSNTILTASQSGLQVCVSAAVTMTLPARVSGLNFSFKTISNTATIASPDAANIYVGPDNASTLTLPVGCAVDLYCDGSNWIARSYSGFAHTQAGSDNTNKTATTAMVQSALTTVAPINSPAFTGTPTAPTVGGTTDNSTKLATTAFVQAVASALTASSTNKIQLGKFTIEYGNVSSGAIGTGTTHTVSVSWSAPPAAVDFVMACFITAQGGCSVGANTTSSTTADITLANLSGTTQPNLYANWFVIYH